jgi:hypothetical protein
MSIRSGEHSCGPKNLVVCSWRARSEPPRRRQAHGAGQSFLRLEPQLHIYGARTFTYASTHIGVSIRAGRHHATVRSIQLTLATLRGGALCSVSVRPTNQATRNVSNALLSMAASAVPVARSCRARCSQATFDYPAWKWGCAVCKAMSFGTYWYGKWGWDRNGVAVMLFNALRDQAAAIRMVVVGHINGG